MRTRLSDKQIWDWPAGIIAFCLNALLTLIMDVVRLQSYNWLWFVPSLSSFALVSLIGYLFSMGATKMPQLKHFWVVNLSLAGALGSLKNVTVNMVAPMVGLQSDQLWTYRALGGFFGGLALMGFYAFASGARREHASAVTRLNEIQSRLLNQRNSLQNLVDQENQKLIESTQSVLMPRLQQLQSMLSNATAELAPVLDHLRETIENQLRPLTRGVLGRASLEITAPEPLTPVSLSPARLPRKVLTRDLIRPWRTFFFNATAATVIFALYVGWEAIGYATATVAIGTLLQSVARFALPKQKSSLSTAIYTMLLFGLIDWLPTGVLIATANRPEWVEASAAVITFVMFECVLLLTGYSLALDLERSRIEEQLERDNETLAHDISLYEQKLWVFRKSWQLVLHGSVQAALTAATTRLSHGAQEHDVKVQLVLQDLQRAESALQSNPTRQIDLHRAISEITTTWHGVCDVTVDVSERASRVLKRNFEAMFCVNEIMREAVSNAVRHGQAKKVLITLERISDDVIELSARNDGVSVSPGAQPGLGSKMLDELTQSWSISIEKRSGLIELKAAIPV